MLVIPLGLGTKLRRWPWATLAMAVVWIAVMVFDRSSDQISDGLFRASAQRGVKPASRNLFVEYCKSRHGDLNTCRRYSLLVWTGFPDKSERRPSIKLAEKVKHPGLRQTTKKPDWETPKAIVAMEQESKQSTKIRSELKDCGHKPKCFVYKDILWRFFETQRNQPKVLAGFKGYASYMRAINGYRQDLLRLCQKSDCLISTNINPASLLMAQLRHGSLTHLAGNLIVFIIFGIYVEQRTRRWLYIGITALGGTFGLLVHARFFGDADTLVIGGSANISTVLGMFYVFFFHKRMRLQVWLPRRAYMGTPFYAEVKYCFPLLFVLSDLAGGFDSGFSNLLTSHVAHFAHLSGFLFGVVSALIIVRMWRLPKAFIYEPEVKDMQALEASRDMGEILSRARTILNYNPDNVHAMEFGCYAYLCWAPTVRPADVSGVFESGRGFVSKHLQSVCAINTRGVQERYACKLLDLMPLYMPFRIYLANLGQINALRLGDYALQNGSPMLALRLYDFYLSRFPLAIKATTVEDTACNVIGALVSSVENVAALNTFLVYHPDSLLATRIGAWIANVSDEGKVA